MRLAEPSADGHRGDIDGLRALAVVPVCAFHAGAPLFPGGFIGVDIFFVISGYLMARMIGQGLSQGDFSIVEFYQRRILRIFPALAVVLIFTVIAASILAPPRLYADFGSTLTATVGFASNLAFSRKSANYFDAPTELNPLLHTWSLAVEEQFYILFPLCLALVWRFGQRTVFTLTGLAAAASFALSVWGTANAPTATFYLLPTRAWELLIGAMLVLWPGSRAELRSRFYRDGAAGLFGLALIGYGLMAFEPEMAFPGAAALVPCLGAALLIHAGRDARTPAARLLSLRPFQIIGRLSYSLYLWHWPLLVFLQKYHWPQNSVALRALLVPTTLLAAYASWRWVERPFRGRHGQWPQAAIFAAAACGMGLLGLIGMGVEASNGWPQRFPGLASVSLERQIAEEPPDPAWAQLSNRNCFVETVSDWDEQRCILSGRSQNKALLWGDSFAARYAYGLFASKAAAFDALQFTSPACPPILNYHAASNPSCTPFNAAVPAIIKRHGVSVVIMAANWDSYLRRRKMRLDDMQRTVTALRQLGVRVVLIGQSPVFGFPYPDEYFYQAYGAQQAERSYRARLAADPGLNDRISLAAKADVFFDPMRSLCDRDRCLFKDGGHYLFEDYGHFTQVGSLRVVARLLDEMAK